MKNSIVVALTLFVVSVHGFGLNQLDSTVSSRQIWSNYKLQYNKVYKDHKEEDFRFNLFMQRLNYVLEHNSDEHGFKLGINHLSDKTSEELSALNGLKMSADNPVPTVSLEEIGINNDDGREIPTSVNWAEFGDVVSPVKDQGDCGSCWAFSTSGLVEGQERLLGRKNVTPLSEQQLIDCDREVNDGCCGGDMWPSLEYIQKAGGLESEESYPYKSSSGYYFNCTHDGAKSVDVTKLIKKYGLIKVTEEELSVVVARYGPVAVGINGTGIQFYESGVYSGDECHGDFHNHAVLLVGYGTTEEGQDYWILKNSWGQDWGQNGYFWLARNTGDEFGLCGLLVEPTVVIL